MGNSKLDRFVYGILGLSVLVMLAGVLLTFNPSLTDKLRGVFGVTEMGELDFETLVVDSTQDNYLLCPEDICLSATSNEPANVYRIKPSLIRQRLLAYADSRPYIKLRNIDMDLQQFEFTEQSPNMRLPDIITIRIIDIGGDSSMLAIYSRSVLDSGRPGTNEERVCRWLDILTRSS